MNNTAGEELMFWDVKVTYLVSASSKEQAVATASLRINEHTVQLDRVTLVDEKGGHTVFRLERVERLQWTKVESTEYNGRYKVFGHIRLALSVKTNAESKDAMRCSTFKLPRSAVHDKPVFVIPAMSEHAFTQVISQSTHWNTGVNEPAAAARVVYL
ncbi:hypothetical protein AB6A23_05830 [Paenibacillus tarimensis]